MTRIRPLMGYISPPDRRAPILRAMAPLARRLLPCTSPCWCFIWGFLATGWNILGGYCGQHSLGHGLYMGIGAYFAAFLLNRCNLTPWLGLFLALVVARRWRPGSSAGSCSATQLKGAYFALVTIALTEAAVYVVSNVQSLRWRRRHPGDTSTAAFSGCRSDSKLVYYFGGVALVVFGLLFTQFYSRQRFFYHLRPCARMTRPPRRSASTR